MTDPDSDAGTGTVYLVGAGPGDPELLTVKAHRLLETADVVLHDALIDDEVLRGIPPTTRVVDVGKRPGPDGERTTQAEINDLMVDLATRGRAVVRLKGGDPTVFGRGGEEAEHLAANGVAFEVVPGVTSAVGGPGAVGIPLTHREHASALTVVTGHETPDKDDSALDWAALAATVRAGGTLVILMGVRTLPDNIAALRAHGVRADCPAAMIERATWDDETTVTGTLETIVEDAEQAGIKPPALTVVGDVVAVRERVREQLHRGQAGSAIESRPGAAPEEPAIAALPELSHSP